MSMTSKNSDIQGIKRIVDSNNNNNIVDMFK